MLTTTTRASRLDEVNRLEEEYNAAVAAFNEAQHDASAQPPSPEDQIRRYESLPDWQFRPRFLSIAEADPTDEAAYRACLWLIDFYNEDRILFDTEQRAWRIIAENHASGDDVPKLCLMAVQRLGPAQEKFLRGILQRSHLPREHAAFATIALGELLARKVAYIEDVLPQEDLAADDEFMVYLRNRRSPKWGKDLILPNAEKFRAEAAELFRTVLAHYADVPCTISMPYFRDISKLGDKAEKSLHALEKLRLGAEAPDIVGKGLDGKPLKLRDYRGRVVLISFWHSSCGPCIAMVPKERELVEKFKDRPFTLLAVCADRELEEGAAAANEYGIDWPCWHDGDNGPIARAYNIQAWPTFYLLDKDGRIISKKLKPLHMAIRIEQLLNATSP